MADTFLELKSELENSNLVEYILKKQSVEVDLEPSFLRQKIENIANVMIQTIKEGMKADSLSESGLSGKDTALLNKSLDSSLPEFMIASPFQKKAMLYALATIEQNARMGKISACPTAGSSGIVPAVLISAMEEFNFSKDDLVDALIVAGEIGRIISLKIELAGASAGCQAECGVASAMASSGLAYMFNSSLDVIFNSASLALKNLLGLTCDPVAGLVEVPCVKRNAFLAIHAITSFYLAKSGVESKIPLDDVVDAMKETGAMMNGKLKESSEAGLATTKTGQEIRNELYKKWQVE